MWRYQGCPQGLVEQPEIVLHVGSSHSIHASYGLVEAFFSNLRSIKDKVVELLSGA